MNAPARAIRPASPAYESDGYGWAMAQAALIRARRFDEVDWDNVAEEVESVGKQEMALAEAALELVLRDRIKWQIQPTLRSQFWADGIAGLLDDFDRVMDENPSLQARLPEMVVHAHRQARGNAAIETGFDHDAIPAEPPGWDEIRVSVLKRAQA